MNSRNLSLYIYAHHNPIKLKDPDGNSTWVNNNGDVQAVFNDSNLGIYESLPSGIAGPPQKVGETLFWDSFTKNGSAAQPLGHVNVGSDITSRVQKIADKAKDMSLLGVSLDSRDGRPLDIKASMSGVSGRNKAQEGFLFQKKYVTLRDAGNILYGMNMKNQGLSRDQAMRAAGGWAQTKSMVGAALGLAGKEYGTDQYFGEDAITGSRIDHGYGLVNE